MTTNEHGPLTLSAHRELHRQLRKAERTKRWIMLGMVTSGWTGVIIARPESWAPLTTVMVIYALLCVVVNEHERRADR